MAWEALGERPGKRNRTREVKCTARNTRKMTRCSPSNREAAAAAEKIGTEAGRAGSRSNKAATNTAAATMQATVAATGRVTRVPREENEHQGERRQRLAKEMGTKNANGKKERNYSSENGKTDATKPAVLNTHRAKGRRADRNKMTRKTAAAG